MANLDDCLNCDPKGNFVTRDRVSKFKDVLEEGEKTHFLFAVNWLKNGGRKISTSRQDYVLFTDRRILVLIRKVTGEDKEMTISYENLSSAELKTGIQARKVILSGKDKEIIFKLTSPGKEETQDAVKFVQNMIDGKELSEGLTEKSESLGDHFPIGDYVTEKRIRKIESILDSSEKVHYFASGQKVSVNGEEKQAAVKLTRIAFTDRRVAVKIPQTLGTDERTIPYEQIRSIDLNTGIINKEIVLQTGDSYKLYIMNPGKAECRQIVKFVREKMKEDKTQGQNQAQNDDPLDKLERLKDLKEQGALTEEEFSQKKSEILDQI